MNNKSKIQTNVIQLSNDKCYNKFVSIILIVSLFFLVIRFGGIVLNTNELILKVFKIENISITIFASYILWIYLYFCFYQKFYTQVVKEKKEIKENVFRDKFSFLVLNETHKRHKHNFDDFNIHTVHFMPVMSFFISYSPISYYDYGEEKEHEQRSWIIKLTIKHNRKYIFSFLNEIYLKTPIVTLYIIPFYFPIFVFILCFTGNWLGSLKVIFKVISNIKL